MKTNTKHRLRPDVSISQAIAQLKDEILAQVRLISNGQLFTMGGVVDLDRQLQELQKELKPVTEEDVAAPVVEDEPEPALEAAAPLAPIRPVDASPKKVKVKKGFKTKARRSVNENDF